MSLLCENYGNYENYGKMLPKIMRIMSIMGTMRIMEKYYFNVLVTCKLKTIFHKHN